MKKIMFAVLLAVLALGIFSSVAGAQTIQQNPGPLHEYMEKALAGKLGISLADIEAQFDAGKTPYQIALDNGITQANLPAVMLEVRTKAINAALADGVITQTQADKMLHVAGRLTCSLLAFSVFLSSKNEVFRTLTVLGRMG